MPKNNETTTKFKVDISELKNAMQEAKRQISVTNSEFKAISSSMDNWRRSTDGLQAKLNQLDTKLTSQKKILRSLEDQYELTVAEMGEGSAAADRLRIQINNQKAAINNTDRELGNYRNELERVEQAQLEALRSGRTLDEVLDDTGDSAREAGEGFTVLKGVLADLVADGIRLAIDSLRDFAKEAVTTGMDFEASMSEVGAISGATGKDLELLENTAKEFGATTVFSASESAQALKYMALAGWDAEKSASALGGVLDLAAASGMDLAQASDMVTDYMSAFGMEADKSTYFADMLAFAQSNANTSAEQLGEAYKNSAANLNAAGQDVETVTALLSMMANQGFKGSEAGTALTAIMRDLTAKMKDGQIMIGKTAITVQDANGNYRDLTDILTEVEAATNGMGDAERATALSTTFTADSTKGLNLLLNAGVGEAAKFEEALRKSGGTAAEMGAAMNDNAAGDVKALQSALESVKITLYEELQPKIREFTQYLTESVVPGVKGAIEGFKKFKQNISDALPIITGLGVALGGLALTALVGNFTAVIAAFKSWTVVTKLQAAAQTALNIAMKMNPIGIIISLIAGLVVAFVLLWNKSEAFRNFWIGLWDGIKNTFSTVADFIVNFFTVTIPETFNNVITTISNFITSVGESIGNFFTVTIPEFIQTTIQWFQDLPYKIGFALGYVIGKLIEWGTNMLYFVTTEIPKIIDNIITFFSELPGKIWEWLVNTITKIIQWREDMKAKAIEAGSNFLNTVVNFIKELPAKIWTWLVNTISKLNQWREDMKTKGKEAITGLINNVIEGAKSIPDKMMTIGKNIVDGVWQGIKNAKDKFMENVKGFFSGVLDGVKGALGIHSPSKVFADEIGKWIPKGVAVGIDANADSALKSMKNLSAELVATARGGLTNASTSLNSSGSMGGVVNNFTQINNSPKPLSRLEIYRQSKNLLGYAGGV